MKGYCKKRISPKYGVFTKRKILVYDGKDQDGLEFAKEVVGSLGDFSTSNQWSVDNLIEQM